MSTPQATKQPLQSKPRLCLVYVRKTKIISKVREERNEFYEFAASIKSDDTSSPIFQRFIQPEFTKLSYYQFKHYGFELRSKALLRNKKIVAQKLHLFSSVARSFKKFLKKHRRHEHEKYTLVFSCHGLYAAKVFALLNQRSGDERLGNYVHGFSDLAKLTKAIECPFGAPKSKSRYLTTATLLMIYIVNIPVKKLTSNDVLMAMHNKIGDLKRISEVAADEDLLLRFPGWTWNEVNDMVLPITKVYEGKESQDFLDQYEKILKDIEKEKSQV